jgi:hypothetical protein
MDSAASSPPAQPASNDLLAVARQMVEERRKKNPRTDAIDKFDNEYRMYLIDAKTVAGDDPLEYWKRKKDALPIIYSVAVDILAIPATSAPVERVFSKASLVLKKNRHNLSDEKMELEVFFRFNSKYIKMPLAAE